MTIRVPVDLRHIVITWGIITCISTCIITCITWDGLQSYSDKHLCAFCKPEARSREAYGFHMCVTNSYPHMSAFCMPEARSREAYGFLMCVTNSYPHMSAFCMPHIDLEGSCAAPWKCRFGASLMYFELLPCDLHAAPSRQACGYHMESPTIVSGHACVFLLYDNQPGSCSRHALDMLVEVPSP